MRTIQKVLATSLGILGLLSLAVAEVPAATTMELAATRIANARVYQENHWTLPGNPDDPNDPGETPLSVGLALAQLTPTWVAGLLRLNSGADLSQQQIDDFNTIRNLVLETSPECKFDIVLNAGQYNSADQLVGRMEEVNSVLVPPPDIWFFEKFQETYKHQKNMIDAAIAYAHSQGQFIGGDSLGNKIPTGSDFAAVEDNKFKLKQNHIKHLNNRYHIPVIMHLTDNINTSEPRIFIKVYDTGQRVGYITSLAVNQHSWEYRLMYPIFYPLYPADQAYDSIKDSSILAIILGLMEDFN